VEDRSLETAVFGDQGDVIEKLDEFSNSRHKRAKRGQLKVNDNILKPVWTDDDPTIETHSTSKVVKAVEKWARLPCQASDTESHGDSGSDSETAVDDETGNYLSSSNANLPSGELDIKKHKIFNADRPAKGKLKSVEFHKTAQILLTAGMDQTLRLFQVDGLNNPCIQSIFLDTFPIHTAHFSHDGQQVILGSRHSAFFYFDMIAGKLVNVPRIKALDGCSMGHFDVSPDGKFLAFMGRYGSIHFLTAQSKEWVGSVKMNGDVSAIAYNSDGSKLFSHGTAGEVYVWDVRQRSCCHKFTDEGCALRGTSITVSPGDQFLATGSETGFVNIYDMETCLHSAAPKPLKAVDNLTTSCTFTKFNATAEILAIASDSQDAAMKLVHVPSLTVFSNFPGRLQSMHNPTCADWSLNSGYLAVGNNKGQALQYRLKHYSNY